MPNPRTPLTSCAAVAFLLLTLTACGQRDRVINVSKDDAEMNAAMAKARNSLPQFWKAFDKREKGEKNFSLKVKIQDKNGVEYFWATGIERLNGKVMGTIDNDPDTVRAVKLGDRIEIPETDIADWLYMRGGKMIGNETLKPLFKSMPAADVEKMKKIMAEP